MFKEYVMSMMNHQKFEADTGANGGGSAEGAQEGAEEQEENNNPDESESKKTEDKLFSRGELAKIVAVETKKAVEEAEKRRGLSEDEKAKLDLEKEREVLEQEKVQLQQEKNETVVLKFLASEKLPESLSSVFTPLLADSETLEKAMSEVATSFRTALDEAVNERLKRSTDTPATGGNSNKLSIGEQMAKELNQQKQTEVDFWKTN